jgi:Na+/proline symporter
MTRLTPWAGWIGGLLGWVASDQVGTSFAQADCTKADLPVMIAIGATGAAIVIVGGLISLSAWRNAGDLDRPGAGTRHFLAGTGLLAACIFLLAIIFQTMSSFIIPQCHV